MHLDRKSLDMDVESRKDTRGPKMEVDVSLVEVRVQRVRGV